MSRKACPKCRKGKMEPKFIEDFGGFYPNFKCDICGFEGIPYEKHFLIKDLRRQVNYD